MKIISKLSKAIIILLYLHLNCQNIYSSFLPTIIYTPRPLIKITSCDKSLVSYIPYLEQAIVPITLSICFGCKQNEIFYDIVSHPYITTAGVYAMLQYYYYNMKKNYDEKINNEIEMMLQNTFYLLIIGHGIYNKITSLTPHFKNSISIEPESLKTLLEFLYSGYDTWQALFSYYKKNCSHNQLYAYKTNQINFFEVLQASAYDPELFSLVLNFYHKDHFTHNYDAIIQSVEQKLKLIDLRLVTFQENFDRIV